MPKARGLFITGTDTGVGKTLVTAILATILRQQGMKVGVMKPFETGFTDLQDPARDALVLQKAAECTADLAVITPYLFAAPLAPVVAAELVGCQIDLQHVVHCYEQLTATHDIVLVEGAGGLLVPITEQESFLDLAALLDLPIVVVARNMLGTINHTALTVSAAAQRCTVRGIIINTLEPRQIEPSQQYNVDALRRWGRAPLLGIVPFAQDREQSTLLQLGANLDLAAILRDA